MKVTVVGIGAMGGGMARALLESDATTQVVGFDRSTPLVHAFYEEAKVLGKAPCAPPSTMAEAIRDTQVVLLVMVNESQCESVCFGPDDGRLASLLPAGTCVILSSTVTATWAKKARDLFYAKGILFVDSPISGGPVRARSGELTMMASGDDASLAYAKPLLDAMGKDVHIIKGGAGMGSTVKMVHQLLAGVHVATTAEALALAAKAGLDVQQMYEIVNGAAGASWMFQDRGKRMISEGEPPVMSALNIFVKDLDIVYSEAKTLQSPIPIAASALQQFISGMGLGLGAKDDSQLVKVYENVTGVKVGKESKHQENETVWKMEDGSSESIWEVGDEPRHKIVISNDYVRALRVSFPPKDTTFAHRHEEDSIYFFLVEGGLDVVNHVQGSAPVCDCMDFGEVRYGTHKSDKPLVHKITNMTDKQMLCIDAEVLKKPPVTAAIPLVAEKHELIKTRDKCRVYKLTLEPGESVTVTYPFFHFTVVLKPSPIKTEINSGRGVPSISWSEANQLGDVAWKEPVANLKQTNVGETVYELFIAEWR
jgi:L-threonate 2-dehydrogenase